MHRAGGLSGRTSDAGGTFLEGSHPGKTDNPASPHHTGDERPPRRMAMEGVHGMAGNAREWVTPVWFVPGSTPVNEE